jgi:hypothetical protein
MGQPATVIPLRCAADRDGPDPYALWLGPGEIPSVKVDAGTRGSRNRLFVPSTAWPELAAVVAAGVSGRSVGLWLAIRMQAKLERRDWVRVRTHLRESLGFTNRAAHSRAVAELERLGFIEVRRRKGYAPLVRLVPRRTGERTGEVEDKAGG